MLTQELFLKTYLLMDHKGKNNNYTLKVHSTDDFKDPFQVRGRNLLTQVQAKGLI